MNLYRINISPSGGFYSQIKGDMLFGVFCWAVAEKCGDDFLKKCLDGYKQGNPFAVFSDAFPSGYLPKPTLPATYYGTLKQEFDPQKRKELKRKNWIEADKISLPSTQMSDYFKEVSFMSKYLKTSVHLDPVAQHTTKGTEYSAYTAEQFAYSGDLDLYVLIDEAKIEPSLVQELLKEVGLGGYGKKSSSGCGKFVLKGNLTPINYNYAGAQSFLTLAPCVPQEAMFDSDNSYYHIFVRFGRHGNMLARSACPFKKPILTADCGAVFKALTPTNDTKFIGNGIGGVSRIHPETVYQGYAPVIPLNLREAENE